MGYDIPVDFLSTYALLSLKVYYNCGPAVCGSLEREGIILRCYHVESYMLSAILMCFLYILQPQG